MVGPEACPGGQGMVGQRTGGLEGGAEGQVQVDPTGPGRRGHTVAVKHSKEAVHAHGSRPPVRDQGGHDILQEGLGLGLGLGQGGHDILQEGGDAGVDDASHHEA